MQLAGANHIPENEVEKSVLEPSIRAFFPGADDAKRAAAPQVPRTSRRQVAAPQV
jgi:hypothetical protein